MITQENYLNSSTNLNIIKLQLDSLAIKHSTSQAKVALNLECTSVLLILPILRHKILLNLKLIANGC